MEPTTSGSAAELALWRNLMVRALRRGVPYADAQDLASQAMLKALAGHLPERGPFAPFCGTIHANLLRNWWRDRKPAEPWDEESHDQPGPDDPQAAFADEEERVLFAQIADRILAALDAEEAALFLALGDQCREAERAAVSAAARELGIRPLTAWNIFRRIQRKAKPFMAEFAALGETRMTLREPLADLRAIVKRVLPAARPSEAEEDRSSMLAWEPPLLFSPLAQAAAAADAGFGAFAARLEPAQRARLSALLG